MSVMAATGNPYPSAFCQLINSCATDECHRRNDNCARWQFLSTLR